MLKRLFRKPISIIYASNTESDDVKLALKILWKGKEFSKGSNKKLARIISNHFASPNIYLFDSARSAQYALLHVSGIGSGDKVAIQSFNCVAVVNSIKWLGAEPLIIDISKDNLNMDPEDLRKKIDDKTRAVIIQHTFGFPADIDEIKKICDEKNIILIEDCSHMIGSKYKGRKIGTFGDASFFSLGRDKAFSSSFGGVLIINNKDLNKRVANMYRDIDPPDWSWTRKEIWYPVLVSVFVRPLYNFFYIGPGLLIIFQKLGLVGKATEPEEKTGREMPPRIPSRMPEELAAIAINQLEKYDRFQEHRKILMKIYDIGLGNLLQSNHFGIELMDYPGKDFVLLRYPVLVKNSESILRTFRKKYGIVLGDWYDQVIGPKEVDLQSAGYKSDCPNAEYASSRIINLPLNIKTSERDAYEIVSLLKEVLENGSE